jgi:hypothetical protein
LAQVGGLQELEVGRTPKFVVQVDSWIARLRAGLRITPRQVESSFELHEVEISFANPIQEHVSGRIDLIGPRGWRLTPAQIRFSLQPGETFRRSLAVRFPYNEPAGPKHLDARFSLQLDRDYDLAVQLPLEVGLRGIEVQTVPHLLGDRLVVRQTITNMTAATVNFRAAVALPYKPPQRRPIPALAPGQSTTKTYVFEKAGDFLGRKLYAVLEEVQGPRLFNEVIPIR